MIKILEYEKVNNADIFSIVEPKVNVSEIVAEIIANVRNNGDLALYDYSEKFDKVKLTSLQVSEEEIDEAFSIVEPKFINIIEKAKENITFYHKNQVKEGFELKKENGVILGQKVIPLDSVGVYVPGGTASYPSTVLMDIIPAKIAGCKNITMITPPNKEGKVNPYILVASKIAGADRIYKVGGAQGVGALAYGTETIKKVDKIVGPGNSFVAEAKKQVFGVVSIDMIAGPSEILIVADGKSNAKHISADLLSQAEHDKLASAVLITDSMDFAKQVQQEIEIQLKELDRYEIARSSIDDNGKIIVAKNIDVCIDIANEIAPEHLELCFDNPFDYLDKIRHAGSIFMGRNCPEALGDYMAGTNHTLPTRGTAKFSSPLSVNDFVKKTQYTYYTKQALCDIAYDVEYFANKEGLTAHAKSAVIRCEKD